MKAWKDEDSFLVTPDLKLILTMIPPPISAQNMLLPIFPSLPLFNLKTLTLGIVLARTLLEDTFGQLSCLQNIKVVGLGGTYEFIKSLICKPKNHDNKHSAVSFPALQSLWIHRFSFDNRTLSVEDLKGCLVD